MIKSLQLAGVFILSALLFSSCKDCDTTVIQVSEDEAKWLVYDRGDSARFVNEKNEIVRFVNTGVRVEQVPGEGFNISDNCIERYDVQAASFIEDIKKSYPGLATYILKRPETFEVVLIVENGGDHKINTAQPTYPTKDINNTLYSNVFEVVKTDSTKTTNLKRLLFNKEVGFLSVEYYNGKKLVRVQ
jgi:hypothetical protein